ncbi:uncharacterized protein LOC143349576 [Colletes latitarsis]|uniref:uncharacterized protein LOC143349576 n=1 Tax=Colletes latitarsis TaxID=2605962 RepID=UPI0040362A2A
MESYYEEEMEEEDSVEMDKFEGTEDELIFPPILAEERREYSTKEEFIYLLYNDMLKYFIKKWDGKFATEKSAKKFNADSGEESDEDEDAEEIQDGESTNKLRRIKSEFKTGLKLPWKLTLPDEIANITFINNNTYRGYISRKMMEGKGLYRWSNGAQYKGEFEQNLMHGRGLLEWNNNCWYEGDFANGYRHGRGLLVNGDNRFMYTGQWDTGCRHGKGYCRFGDNDSYDGDWVMEKMSGVGLRIYSSGSRYVGQWKNGLRHGVGTMVWTNGDVYRGEWKCGAMNGYGEYVWGGFFNKTFTWPQEAVYMGYWRHGMRHGKGELKLKSVGGAKYSGYWKDNKKHGPGIIIGNNGEKFEADPLFLNDILVSFDTANGTLKDQLETKETSACVRTLKEIEPLLPDKPTKLQKASITTVLKPEQSPSLSYYLNRLLDPKRLEPHFVSSVPSGKCYTCENQSCSCLKPLNISKFVINKVTSDEKTVTNSINDLESNWEYEQRWVYNCLTLHMSRLRQIYKDYAKLFATSPPQCSLTMSRLCLWQLWRDCGINKRGLSLIEIDNYIAKNESTFVKDRHHPFEKIEIWQFLHALLEVSWHLYTKCNDIELQEMNGKLAGGLHRLLINDIYPHVGNHIGSLCREYQDLLPMHCVFKLYQNVGYPCSAKDLLRATCVAKDTPGQQSSSKSIASVEYFSEGINAVTIGEKVSYLLKVDEIFPTSRGVVEMSRKCENNLLHGLIVFKQLGAVKMIEIITLTCPGIKDSNIIINMDYEKYNANIRQMFYLNQ